MTALIPEHAAKHAEIKKVLAAAVTRAWQDPDFAARLLKDPQKALQDSGFQLPTDVKNIHFHQDSEDTVHFVVPPSPAGDFKDNVAYHLQRLASLHVEFTSTVSWVRPPM